jgi:subtilisin family serine protease
LAEKFNGDPRTNLRYFKEFDCSDIFSGLVLETDTGNADSLRAMSGVANVWPMESVPIAPIPEQTPVSLQTSAANYTAHRFTGVDRLHAEGIRGKGATVAIIDSGIDYTHRAVCHIRTFLSAILT